LIDGPGHAGSNAEDIASRPWGECAPVIETSNTGSNQSVEQVLLAEFRRLRLIERLDMQISGHDDALTAYGATLTYRTPLDSDRHPMLLLIVGLVLLIQAPVAPTP
jgi:hypothetical protein